MQIGDVICVDSDKIAKCGTIFPDETYAQNDPGEINGDYLVLGLHLGDEHTNVYVLMVPIVPSTDGEWLPGNVHPSTSIVRMLLHSGVSGVTFTLVFVVNCLVIYCSNRFLLFQVKLVRLVKLKSLHFFLLIWVSFGNRILGRDIWSRRYFWISLLIIIIFKYFSRWWCGFCFSSRRNIPPSRI